MKGRQLLEGFVEGDDVDVLLFGVGQQRIERLAAPVAAALGGLATPGVIHQHFAHGLGGGAEEVSAVRCLPQDAVGQQASEGLVEQGGGLERVPGRLVVHQALGNLVQLLVNPLREPCLGRRAAGTDLLEESRHLALGVG
jgi:hypothetical protein